MQKQSSEDDAASSIIKDQEEFKDDNIIWNNIDQKRIFKGLTQSIDIASYNIILATISSP